MTCPGSSAWKESLAGKSNNSYRKYILVLLKCSAWHELELMGLNECPGSRELCKTTEALFNPRLYSNT